MAYIMLLLLLVVMVMMMMILMYFCHLSIQHGVKITCYWRCLLPNVNKILHYNDCLRF